MKTLNLTQHPASAEQKEVGVYDLEDTDKLKGLLTFDSVPSYGHMILRALDIIDIVKKEGATDVMIGGAPFFMPILEEQLLRERIVVRYAFSKRESVEEDGVKKSVFRHLGFVTKEPEKESNLLFQGALSSVSFVEGRIVENWPSTSYRRDGGGSKVITKEKLLDKVSGDACSRMSQKLVAMQEKYDRKQFDGWSETIELDNYKVVKGEEDVEITDTFGNHLLTITPSSKLVGCTNDILLKKIKEIEQE